MHVNTIGKKMEDQALENMQMNSYFAFYLMKYKDH